MMEQLARDTAEFGIHLSPGQLVQFETYQSLLLDWNQRLNLTAIREPHQIQRFHFLDSLTCATITGDLNGRSLIDVGTGAGFPGLPLKILFPRLQLTLVESIAKKARFLEAVIDKLSLNEINVLVDRVEVVGQLSAFRGQFDWAVARAVAALPILVEYLLPLCRIGGHMLAQKGAGAPTEVEEATSAVTKLGGGMAVLKPIQLPLIRDARYLVVIEKLAPTPEFYPRRSGMPAKRPLKE